jgi:hypothetical protein
MWKKPLRTLLNDRGVLYLDRSILDEPKIRGHVFPYQLHFFPVYRDLRSSDAKRERRYVSRSHIGQKGIIIEEISPTSPPVATAFLPVYFYLLPLYHTRGPFIAKYL